MDTSRVRSASQGLLIRPRNSRVAIYIALTPLPDRQPPRASSILTQMLIRALLTYLVPSLKVAGMDGCKEALQTHRRNNIFTMGSR